MRERAASLFSCVLLGAVAFTSFTWAARAQELDLSLFLPPAGRSTVFSVEDPAIAPHLTLTTGLALNYARRPLDGAALCDRSGASLCAAGGRPGFVSDLARLDLLAALSLFDAFELGAALPLVLARHDLAQPSAASTHEGVGDLRLSITDPLVSAGPTRMAAVLVVSLPTASRSSVSGSSSWTVWPALVLTHEVSSVTLAAKLGYHLRPRAQLLDLEQDDELTLALGATLALAERTALKSELLMRAGVGGRSFSRRELPMEILIGAQLPAPLGSSLDLGVGTAAWPVVDGYGAPDLRVLVALRGGFALGSSCAAAGGCRELDYDADGVPDALDACPADPEDRDGFLDEDGCPDDDNDADGIADALDACPDRSEDRDGYQDTDGCPEPDNDADGIADGRDECPLDPEDHDGFEDDDGCPEPGPGRPVITIEGSRILMSDRIYFEDGADTIRAVSTLVLDELVQAVLSVVARDQRVRVTGHTDDAGSPEQNMDLSYRRAKAVVEYFVARGVSRAHLEHEGRGAREPLAPNDSPEGRALNRRVELRILDSR